MTLTFIHDKQAEENNLNMVCFFSQFSKINALLERKRYKLQQARQIIYAGTPTKDVIFALHSTVTKIKYL